VSATLILACNCRYRVAFFLDALEEWHRYSLPAFSEPMRSRLSSHCKDGHHPWPSTARYIRHTAEVSQRIREDSVTADIGSVKPPQPKGQRRRLGLVDLDTGEINDL
jgi:hypothetical protein